MLYNDAAIDSSIMRCEWEFIAGKDLRGMRRYGGRSISAVNRSNTIPISDMYLGCARHVSKRHIIKYYARMFLGVERQQVIHMGTPQCIREAGQCKLGLPYATLSYQDKGADLTSQLLPGLRKVGNLELWRRAGSTSQHAHPLINTLVRPRHGSEELLPKGLLRSACSDSGGDILHVTPAPLLAVIEVHDHLGADFETVNPKSIY